MVPLFLETPIYVYLSNLQGTKVNTQCFINMRQAIGVAVHAEISLLMTDKYPIKLQSPNNLLKSGQTTVGFHPEPQHVRGESVEGNKFPAQNTSCMEKGIWCQKE